MGYESLTMSEGIVFHRVDKLGYEPSLGPGTTGFMPLKKNKDQMDYSIKRSVEIHLEMDSSEAVMFNKGGYHQVKLPSRLITNGHDDVEVTIKVQMKKSELGRFNHVTDNKHA